MTKRILAMLICLTLLLTACGKQAEVKEDNSKVSSATDTSAKKQDEAKADESVN